MDYSTLDTLRAHHPAWRLLSSPHAALVASFLHRVFVLPNVRSVSEAELTEALEDVLFALREHYGVQEYPKPALAYLNDWAEADKAWLRKFYKPGSDEAQFDLTPATEKALQWLASLTARPFVGTESRLLTLFSLLEQISAGTETSPEKRLAELRRKRSEIDAEMARIQAGDVPLLDDTAVKERFLQFQQLARELLGDFREVESNFRLLDRKVREKIALWEGSKGALLDEILSDRDAIADSDQGRSFRAFWDFLMSSKRQEGLTQLLDQVLDLPAVAELDPAPRTRRIHHDWLEAGEHTQRMVALLSQQLRRFLDDRAFLENRRILEILHGIETSALAVREQAPSGVFAQMDGMGAEVILPMERPLFTPSHSTKLTAQVLEATQESIDTSSLFEQIVVDKSRLRNNLQRALRSQAQVTLAQLLKAQPLQQGLAELVAYIELAHAAAADTGGLKLQTLVDEAVEEPVCWASRNQDDVWVERCARLPRIIFSR